MTLFSHVIDHIFGVWVVLENNTETMFVMSLRTYLILMAGFIRMLETFKVLEIGVGKIKPSKGLTASVAEWVRA